MPPLDALPAEVRALYDPPPTALNEPEFERTRFAHIRSGATSDQVGKELTVVRQLLCDLGYSVAGQHPHPKRSALEVKVAKGVLKINKVAVRGWVISAEAWPMLRAVEAFQFHYFSGPDREYLNGLMKVSPRPDAKRPKGKKKGWSPSHDWTKGVGHIDAPTIKRLVEVWWSIQRDAPLF